MPLTDEYTITDPLGTQVGRGVPLDNEYNITSFTFDLKDHPIEFTPKVVPLRFTDQEILFCGNELQSLGIPAGAPYVCLHIRTAHYMREQFADWKKLSRYHDYRDSDINDYVPTIRFLNSLGFYVIRLGATATVPSADYNSPLFIDYARNHRSEIMDIFLSMNCAFMISTGSGIDIIPLYYNIPLLIVNYHPIAFTIPQNPLLLISKKLYSHTAGRNLSLKEQFKLGGGYFKSEHLAAHDLEIINNTPEEILTATRELLALIDNKWTASEEYQEKHRKLYATGQFISLLYTNQINTLRFGHDFLLNNTWDM